MENTSVEYDMERMIQQSTNDLLGDTIADDLEKIEIGLGKIGMNSREQAQAVLFRFDAVNEKIKLSTEAGLQNKANVVQYQALLSKLNKEAAGFLRDLGGAHRLIEIRGQVNPDPEKPWWYLDEYLAAKRKAAVNRTLIYTGAIVIVLVLLAVVYQNFFAPSPEVAGRYTHEQSARSHLVENDLEQALIEIEQGLSFTPDDSTLLVLKAVVLEQSGKQDEAQTIYDTVIAVFDQVEDFYNLRGQDYIQANQPDKALKDAQAAIQVNPESPQAYLLAGQAYELKNEYQPAIDAYNHAYEAADIAKEYELAAIARMRIAMMVQSMDMQITPPAWMLTETPEQ